MTADPTGLTPATVAGVFALTPPALIVGYGVARAGASLCNEARNAVFAQARWAALCASLLVSYNAWGRAFSLAGWCIEAVETGCCCACSVLWDWTFNHFATAVAMAANRCLQVTQGAIRAVANKVFGHLHGMDLGFHLSRQVRPAVHLPRFQRYSGPAASS
jgi:hypothetical protein